VPLSILESETSIRVATIVHCTFGKGTLIPTESNITTGQASPDVGGDDAVSSWVTLQQVVVGRQISRFS